MSDSPASVLFDEDGNAVAIVADGTTYRLETSSRLIIGPGGKKLEYQDSPVEDDYAEVAVTNREMISLLQSINDRLGTIEFLLKGMAD